MQQSLGVFLTHENTRIIPSGSYDRLGLRASLGMPPIGESLSYIELVYLCQTFNISTLEKIAYFMQHSFKWNNTIYVYEINQSGHLCCICVKK